MRKLLFAALLVFALAFPSYAAVGVLNSTGFMIGTATDIQAAGMTNLSMNTTSPSVVMINTGNTTNATVHGTLEVTGATTLDTTLAVTGNSTLSGTLTTVGNSTLANVSATGLVAVTGAETVSTTLGVTGNTTLSANVNVTGNATVNGYFGIANGTSSGIATLLNGTILVPTGAITNSSIVLMQRNSTGGTAGIMYISARNAGVNFTITSSQGTDNATVKWLIVN